MRSMGLSSSVRKRPQGRNRRLYAPIWSQWPSPGSAASARPCQLGLRPGPGLTLVVGRNGSGKSSIAEALEFALTGDSLRWAGKSLEWTNGWRNLHGQDNPAITVGLRVDGERELRTVRVNWSSRKLESAKTAVTLPGCGRQSLDSLGWSDAVRTFRPFLPYKELSTISEGRPIDRYNALAPMLGMETLASTHREPETGPTIGGEGTDRGRRTCLTGHRPATGVARRASQHRDGGALWSMGPRQDRGPRHGHRSRRHRTGGSPRRAGTASLD